MPLQWIKKQFLKREESSITLTKERVDEYCNGQIDLAGLINGDRDEWAERQDGYLTDWDKYLT